MRLRITGAGHIGGNIARGPGGEAGLGPARLVVTHRACPPLQNPFRYREMAGGRQP